MNRNKKLAQKTRKEILNDPICIIYHNMENPFEYKEEVTHKMYRCPKCGGEFSEPYCPGMTGSSLGNCRCPWCGKTMWI